MPAMKTVFNFPKNILHWRKCFPSVSYFWQNDWHVGLCVSSQCWLSRLKNSFLVSKDAHQLLDVLYMNRHFSFVYMQCFVWGLASSTHPMNMSHFGISPESSCTAVGWTPEIPLRFLQNSTFFKILPTICCWLIMGLRLRRIHSQTK